MQLCNVIDRILYSTWKGADLRIDVIYAIKKMI